MRAVEKSGRQQAFEQKIQRSYDKILRPSNRNSKERRFFLRVFAEHIEFARLAVARASFDTRTALFKRRDEPRARQKRRVLRL